MTPTHPSIATLLADARLKLRRSGDDPTWHARHVRDADERLRECQDAVIRLVQEVEGALNATLSALTLLPVGHACDLLGNVHTSVRRIKELSGAR